VDDRFKSELLGKKSQTGTGRDKESQIQCEKVRLSARGKSDTVRESQNRYVSDCARKSDSMEKEVRLIKWDRKDRLIQRGREIKFIQRDREVRLIQWDREVRLIQRDRDVRLIQRDR
jgi:hypothetical protein